MFEAKLADGDLMFYCTRCNAPYFVAIGNKDPVWGMTCLVYLTEWMKEHTLLELKKQGISAHYVNG